MTHLCFSRTSWELLKQKKTKFPSNKTGDFSATGEKKSLIQEPRPPGWARNLLAPHPVRRTRKRYRRRGSPTVVRMRVVALVGIELLLLMVFSKSGEFTPMIYGFLKIHPNGGCLGNLNHLQYLVGMMNYNYKDYNKP